MAKIIYEIQVYASPTQAVHSTMFELHSNYTFNGSTQIVNGVLPSNHSLHETLEITTGITPVFEIGAYLLPTTHRDMVIRSSERIFGHGLWHRLHGAFHSD